MFDWSLCHSGKRSSISAPNVFKWRILNLEAEQSPWVMVHEPATIFYLKHRPPPATLPFIKVFFQGRGCVNVHIHVQSNQALARSFSATTPSVASLINARWASPLACCVWTPGRWTRFLCSQMLMPKKNRIAIYELLFKEGVMVAKKDVHLPNHPELTDKNVPNLHVMKAMQVRDRGGWRFNSDSVDLTARCWVHVLVYFIVGCSLAGKLLFAISIHFSFTWRIDYNSKKTVPHICELNPTEHKTGNGL